MQDQMSKNSWQTDRHPPPLIIFLSFAVPWCTAEILDGIWDPYPIGTAGQGVYCLPQMCYIQIWHSHLACRKTSSLRQACSNRSLALPVCTTTTELRLSHNTVKPLPHFNRLFHAPTSTTSSGCLMLHRTVHALWNLYGNPYKNRAEKDEEAVTWWGKS